MAKTTDTATPASDEAALLLAGAPTPMPGNPERGKPTTEVDQYGGGNVGDPEKLEDLLTVAGESIGRPDLKALVEAIMAKASQTPEAPAVVTKTDADRRKEAGDRVLRRALDQQASSPKQQIMLNAIRESPMIVYYSKKERSMMLNRVAIQVPQGRVVIPKLVAEEIDHMDAHDLWAERERRAIQDQAQGDAVAHRRDSFVPRPIERFTLSAT